MVKDLSIIIPIFNTAKYLTECINSILRQELTDIEIICINDGSTDESADIIKKFKSIDNRIKYIEQINQGLSAARNKGILESKSKYIMFVDSDDYISQICAKSLFETATINDADLVLFNSNRDSLNEIYNQQIEVESNDKIEILKSVLSFEIQTSTCFAIIKRDLIIKYKLFFPLNRLYEDASILYKLIHFSKNPLKIKNQFYFYRNRVNSITNSVNNKTIHDIFVSLNETNIFLKDNQYKNLTLLTNGRLCELVNGIIYNLANTFNKEELLHHLLSSLVKHDIKYNIPIEIKTSWLIYLFNIKNLRSSQIFDNLLYRNFEPKFLDRLKYYRFSFRNIFLFHKKFISKNPFYFYGQSDISEILLRSDDIINNFKGFIKSKFSYNKSGDQESKLLNSVDFNEEFFIFIVSISSAFIIKEKILQHCGYDKDKHRIFTFYDLLELNL